MFKYWMYKIGQFFIRRLSLKAAYAFGMFMSDVQYLCSFRDRRIVKENLRVFLGERPDLNALTRDVFRNFGKYLVEFFLMERLVGQEFLRTKVKIENRERLQRVMDEGKGGIVITAHLGNWELGAVLLSMIGPPLVVVALPHKERPVNDLFNRQRRVEGITVVPTSHAVRRCTEALQEKKFVALVADRDFSLKGEILDFLGRETLIPKGPAIFSLRTGVPIIPVFLVREADDTFTLSFGELIYPPARGKPSNEKEMILDIMSRYAAIIEKEIRKYPAQWLMFRKYWAEPEILPGHSLEAATGRLNSSAPDSECLFSVPPDIESGTANLAGKLNTEVRE